MDIDRIFSNVKNQPELTVDERIELLKNEKMDIGKSIDHD